MLLREEGDVVIVIGQASHAWISGQLARAWGNERFAGPAKLLSQSRYAALLVSTHGTATYERRNPATLDAAERQLVHDYLDRQRALQSTLADQLDVCVWGAEMRSEA